MNCKYISLFVFSLFFIIASNAAAQGKTPNSETSIPYGKTGWSTFLRGGYLHQFKTDIDNSSEFSVNRFFIQGGVSYAPEIRRSFSLAIGYGYDRYDFSGSGGFGALDPWSDINSFRISTPVRWGFDNEWTLFVIPTLRTTVHLSWQSITRAGKRSRLPSSTAPRPFRRRVNHVHEVA